jgi:hypothetical protein
MVRKFSDTLLIFMLKARDPKKYRERVDLTHSGPNDGPIAIITAECSVEEATRAYNDLLG